MDVEIYLEYAPNQYDRLDLFDDESINIQFKLKDSSDLSKVYSTFSKTFNVPTSEKNTRLLNYYFNTEVVRDSSRYIKSKIYINKELFKVGFIVINEGKFKYLNSSSYSLNFFTSLTNLKEVFGEELLTETLSNINFKQDFNGTLFFASVADKISVGIEEDDNFITPLVSNKRIWTYEVGAGGVNNIRYTGTNTGVKSIESNELKPAIPFSKIMSSVALSKGLVFKSPLFTQEEYKKLYVWCNRINQDEVIYPVKTTSSWTNSSADWIVSSSIGSEIINIKKVTLSNNIVNLFFNFNPLNEENNSLPSDSSIKYQYINADTGEILKEGLFQYITNFFAGFTINPTLFPNIGTTGLNIKFNVISTYDYLNWANIPQNLFRLISSTSTLLSSSLNNQYNIVYNFFNKLPNIKTIDFITSFIKMFNISIIEDPTDSNVVNFVPRNTFYSEELEYTDYLNVKEHVVKPTTIFKKINFKHNVSKFKSNIDYKVGIVDREYGELLYESPDVFLKDEYKIETKFNIVPNRLIPETKVQTFYGFLDGGTADTTYGTLYKPNSEDFTIFYYNGSQQLKDTNDSNISFNIKSIEDYVVTIGQLSAYNKVSLVYNDNTSTYTNSLGFKDEVDVFNPLFRFEKNLFTNYYKNDIDRIYNPNSRLFEYSFVLPKREINNFSLEKVIKVKDKRFTIEEANINITNGESKLVLMNIAPKVLIGLNSIPTAPTTFTATLL